MKFPSLHLIALAVSVFLLAGHASALSISAPSAVPENSSWGFSVALDPTDKWSSAAVKLDGLELLTVSPNGSVAISPVNGRNVLLARLIDEDAKSTAGLVLYVSVPGFGAGVHAVSAESDGNSDSRNVSFYVPLDQSAKSDFDSRLGSLESSVEGMAADYGSGIGALRKDSNDNWQKLSGLEERLAAVSRKVEAQQDSASKVASLESRLSTIEGENNALKLASEKAASESPLNALANLALGLVWPFAMILGFVVMVGLVLVVKGKLDSRSIYSRRDEHDLPVSKEEGEMADALSSGGKWAKK